MNYQILCDVGLILSGYLFGVLTIILYIRNKNKVKQND